MLIVKGRSGKSVILKDHFVDEDTLIIEYVDGPRISTILNINCDFIGIRKDRLSDALEELINLLLNEKWEKKDHIKMLFYINTEADSDIKMIKKFENNLNKNYELVQIIVTMQSSDNEIKYLEF